MYHSAGGIVESWCIDFRWRLAGSGKTRDGSRSAALKPRLNTESNGLESIRWGRGEQLREPRGVPCVVEENGRGDAGEGVINGDNGRKPSSCKGLLWAQESLDREAVADRPFTSSEVIVLLFMVAFRSRWSTPSWAAHNPQHKLLCWRSGIKEWPL
jgi:hypothetical protein